jgi:hypothetical protein
VYQAAVDTHESKMITVYEIKPEEEGDSTSMNGRDVFVEIVASQENSLMRSPLASNGTLLLESAGNLQVNQSSDYSKCKFCVNSVL